MYLVFSLDTFVLDLRLELSKMLKLARFSVGDNFNRYTILNIYTLTGYEENIVGGGLVVVIGEH